MMQVNRQTSKWMIALLEPSRTPHILSQPQMDTVCVVTVVKLNNMNNAPMLQMNDCLVGIRKHIKYVKPNIKTMFVVL